MSQQLAKSTAIVGGMTLLSRLLGFVRDMLIARFFGASLETDAFFVAFKIPNFFRRLFAEGAFAQAFVPVLADYQKSHNPLRLKQFIDKTAGTLALILTLVTVAGMIIAPLLILLFAPGFAFNSTQHTLAVQLLQIIFPFLIFISLVAFAGAILNAHGKFAVPALTPLFLNIAMIGAMLQLSPRLPQPVLGLAWGVFIGGGLQLLFQLPSLMRLGLLPRLRIDFQDAGVKQVLQLMLPAIFATSLIQVNLLLNTLFASFLPKGSVSWLYYADRLVEFPLGIFGIAIATVILPNLSQHHAAQNTQAFSRSLDWGLKLVLFIGFPATIGLILLAEPLLATLFQYHEFKIYDVQMAGKSLQGYAVGLLGFVLVKVLVPGFTARKDMQTPVRFGLYAIIANIIFNLIFILPLAHAGLALATSLSSLTNATFLGAGLLKEKIYQPAAGWLFFLIRISFASAIMAGGLLYFVDKTQWYVWGAMDKVVHLLSAVFIAILVYLMTLFLTGFRLRHLSIID